ncbi:hypothetical protein NMG60_11035266 [Bertholletia excelsa]
MAGSDNGMGFDPSLYDLEFRATVDDAWYAVRVVPENDDSLVVKFLGFVEACDERFRASDFKTLDAVDDFLQRFRLVSEQLQDSQCSTLIAGTTVCSPIVFADDDVRFYDAVCIKVRHLRHYFVNEEEECLCAFDLLWRHGPKKGKTTSTAIQNVCLIPHFAQSDSRVISFTKMAKEKVEIASHGSVFDGNTSMCKDCAGECSMEGNAMHYLILIENLEKDLSPSSIVQLIHKQTSILPQAYVFPSLSSDLYTRGAIRLDCPKKLEKVYEFLSNPNQLIISSRGRPWVVAERPSKCGGNFRTTPESIMPMSQNRSSDDELKIILRGTKDYKTAECLKNLFKDFVKHQERLHKRLDFEEKQILRT